VALYLSVSVTSQCSVERDGRIEVVFGVQASFNLSYTSILEINSGIQKNKGTNFPLELCPKFQT